MLQIIHRIILELEIRHRLLNQGITKHITGLDIACINYQLHCVGAVRRMVVLALVLLWSTIHLTVLIISVDISKQIRQCKPTIVPRFQKANCMEESFLNITGTKKTNSFYQLMEHL